MADDGLSRRKVLALAGGGVIALGAGTQAHDSGSAPAIPDSGIEQIGWTSDGDEVEGFEQEWFVGGGEQVANITSIGFGGT